MHSAGMPEKHGYCAVNAAHAAEARATERSPRKRRFAARIIACMPSTAMTGR